MEAGVFPLDASAFKDQTFTFLVGPCQVEYTVHQSVIAKISEPLGYIMADGSTEESLEGYLWLEDTDERTFQLFCQYAYTGMYWVPDDEIRRPTDLYHCRACGKRAGDIEIYPHCSQSCVTFDQVLATELDEKRGWREVFCTLCGNTFSDGMPSYRHLCPRLHKLNVTNNEKSERRRRSRSRIPVMSSFESKKYPVSTMLHEDVRAYLESLRPADMATATFPIHARLYVFADHYMINHLKELCLHKLHRDLCLVDIAPCTILEVVELLEYTYTNTSKNDDSTEGVGSALRDLVLSYAVSKASTLLKHEAFKNLLSYGGELVGEFLELVTERLEDSWTKAEPKKRKCQGNDDGNID